MAPQGQKSERCLVMTSNDEQILSPADAQYCFFKQPIYRLRTELAKLRKMYEEQTEKAKNEFMYLHSNKVRLII